MNISPGSSQDYNGHTISWPWYANKGWYSRIRRNHLEINMPQPYLSLHRPHLNQFNNWAGGWYLVFLDLQNFQFALLEFFFIFHLFYHSTLAMNGNNKARAPSQGLKIICGWEKYSTRRMMRHMLGQFYQSMKVVLNFKTLPQLSRHPFLWSWSFIIIIIIIIHCKKVPQCLSVMGEYGLGIMLTHNIQISHHPVQKYKVFWIS